MKHYILLFFCSLQFLGSAQQDSLLSEWKVADTVYGQLGQFVNTGILLNRTLMDTSETLIWNYDDTSAFVPSADFYYQMMNELRLAALDSSTVQSTLDLFTGISSFVGGIEFHEQRYLYPIGIADYKYNYLDETAASQNNAISQQGITWLDNGNSSGTYYSEHKVTMIAPLFDYYSDATISIVFRQEDFKSNYRTASEVTGIEVYYMGTWYNLNFGDELLLAPPATFAQDFIFRVQYSDGTSIENPAVINTPELGFEGAAARTVSDGDVKLRCEVWAEESTIFPGLIPANKAQWCMIPSCSAPVFMGAALPHKPFIFVTGYRPPIFGQSYQKTWKLYNNYHNNLLQRIHDRDFDIFLVRFNIHEQPYAHGMLESAQILERLILYINEIKTDPYNENVIMASSMGSDIVNLTLNTMEKKHFEQHAPPHHCRTFMAYDGNFYGANIPLGYQFQIYSGSLFQTVSLNNIYAQPVAEFLKIYLYATMEQKTVKELLIYHAMANETIDQGVENISFGNPYGSNKRTLYLNARMHPMRQRFYNALTANSSAAYFSGPSHPYPFPGATRNVAISLGKISETNNYGPNLTQDARFNQAGQYWRNVNLGGYQSRIRAGMYSTWHTELFYRKKQGFVSGSPSLQYGVKHQVSIQNMQEVDNASGSYLNKMGNLMKISNAAYFSPVAVIAMNLEDQELFSHKSVLTGLCINPDLWPADGSHTLDMQNLDLMYNILNYNPNQDKSDYYGYPNLGRPNDHFDITPFEAIYVDRNFDAHINMQQSDGGDIEATTNFILRETQPQFLGLQNMTLGTQVLPNYPYLSKRIAENGIYVGHTVTPTTDPGDYTVNPNAKLILKAGEFIDLETGTTVLPGAELTATIEYEGCTGGGRWGDSDMVTDKEPNTTEETGELATQQEAEEVSIGIYPNPSRSDFTLASLDGNPILGFQIYTLNGNLVSEVSGIHTARYVLQTDLPKGTFIIHIAVEGSGLQRKKLMVL